MLCWLIELKKWLIVISTCWLTPIKHPERPGKRQYERTAALEVLLQLLLGDVERKVAYESSKKAKKKKKKSERELDLNSPGLASSTFSHLHNA